MPHPTSPAQNPTLLGSTQLTARMVWQPHPRLPPSKHASVAKSMAKPNCETAAFITRKNGIPPCWSTSTKRGNAVNQGSTKAARDRAARCQASLRAGPCADLRALQNAGNALFILLILIISYLVLLFTAIADCTPGLFKSCVAFYTARESKTKP